MKRLFLSLAVVLTIVALALPVRSQTFTRVTVDGRSTRMLIEGSGPSTVVFENGLGPPLEMWGKVRPEVSRFARTVAYDRAGIGLSDKSPAPRDGRTIASELHDALRAAGVAPPFILVGASFGALYARVYTGMYPDEVIAVILVDPTHDIEAPAQPVHPELDVARETLAQARASRIPPSVPLVLIDARGPRHVPFATSSIHEQREKNRSAIDAESRAYKDWLNTIPGSRLITTDRSGHNVAIEQPDLVVGTIHEVARDLGIGRP